MIILENKKLTLVLNEIGASIDALYFDGIKIADKGMTVGRYANRIKNGKFTINGVEYQLSLNEGSNHLHGGNMGFGMKIWDVKEQSDSYVAFHMFSENGDEGYPGNLDLDVEYVLNEDSVEINYTAYCDEACYVNFTNHSYFNLNGKGEAYAHKMMLDADKYTEVDDKLIPTGKLPDVFGIKYDFRKLRDYDTDLDTNFCLNGEGLRKVAELVGSESFLKLEVYTDQVGIQVYNSKEQICLETQHYPDSPNNDNFPSTLLVPGEEFQSTTIYRFVKE